MSKIKKEIELEFKGYGYMRDIQLDKKEKGMNRRDFLLATALMLTSGKITYDVFNDIHRKKLINRIYNELPCHIHLAIHQGDIYLKNGLKGRQERHKGYGIILQGKYITPEHITNLEDVEQSLFGQIITSKQVIKNKEVLIRDKRLETLVIDKEKDVAIFNLPKDLNLQDFPCKPQTKRRLGETIYLIGNPNLQGLNIRKGTISDLDNFGDVEITKGCFGIDIQVIPGDSGTPVVNENFELLGVARSSTYGSGLGYITKIENYLEELEKLKNGNS